MTALLKRCLPDEAYIGINSRTNIGVSLKLRKHDPVVSELLEELGCLVANTQDWEGAFLTVFGKKAFEEDYYCIDFSVENMDRLTSDAKKFIAAFVMADNFVWGIMHNLYPYQYREAIPALCHALYSWSERRECPLPTLGEEGAIRLLRWANYDHIADWIAK
jgi:hypothetical protein